MLKWIVWNRTDYLLYILWDDWPIFMISGSNEQLQQQLEKLLEWYNKCIAAGGDYIKGD